MQRDLRAWVMLNRKGGRMAKAMLILAIFAFVLTALVVPEIRRVYA